ncbi:hypothetical protein [Roseovarius sp. M141]|uniref:hypothetical protein n=1 Tax=Roseovarius sp. M141 TaxID=2583806 RepID=UPI0020CE475B|nr:hypothetical protein [Roseovarius sp. M141]MCQ0093962.1 hypothetical protein [Roseovarius sp. M141]
MMMDVRVAASDAGVPPPKVFFRRWQGRECLRIDMNGDIIFYDGILAWHAGDDVQSWPRKVFLNRAEIAPEQGDAARSRSENSGRLGALEPEFPASSDREWASSGPDSTEPEDLEEEDADPAPDW